MEGGLSLTEVNRWDLEDIWKAVEVVSMRIDYEAARGAWYSKKFEEQSEK